MAVASMRLGERIAVVARADYGFGEVGQPFGVPGNAMVEWDVELLRIQPKVGAGEEALGKALLLAPAHISLSYAF